MEAGGQAKQGSTVPTGAAANGSQPSPGAGAPSPAGSPGSPSVGQPSPTVQFGQVEATSPTASPIAEHRGSNWGLPNYAAGATGIVRPITLDLLFSPNRYESRSEFKVSLPSRFHLADP